MAFSCIAIGLDQLGKVNLQHGWMTGNRMLQESVKSLLSLKQEEEELYRLDGANFALLGPIASDVAGFRATELRRCLAQSNVQVDNYQLPLISSVGVVSVESRRRDSTTKAADAICEALLQMLYRAKDQGGNTVEIHSSKHF